MGWSSSKETRSLSLLGMTLINCLILWDRLLVLAVLRKIRICYVRWKTSNAVLPAVRECFPCTQAVILAGFRRNWLMVLHVVVGGTFAVPLSHVGCFSSLLRTSAYVEFFKVTYVRSVGLSLFLLRRILPSPGFSWILR